MKYKDWTGNREEFLITVSQLEELNAEDCMLKSSKAPYNLLPVNLRRIQWFASNNIIPPAGKRMYDFEHLVYYMHAILLRKKGKLTFKQIADFCKLHEVEIQGIADGEVAKGIKAYNPIISGQLSREEIELSSKDENRPLNIKSNDIEISNNEKKIKKYINNLKFGLIDFLSSINPTI